MTVQMTSRAPAPAPARPSPAIDSAPPVTPNLPRDERAVERRVGANTIETLLFRGISTPLALVLVVVQSRFLQPSGRGTFVLVILSVTVLARLFGQLGYAVTSRMHQRGVELRQLVHRALGLALLLAASGAAALIVWGHFTRGVGYEIAAIASCALGPTIVWQCISGILLGLGQVRLWNWIQLLPPLLTLLGIVLLVVVLDLGVKGAVIAWAAAHVLTAFFALVATQAVWRPFSLEGILDLLGLTLARLALVMGAVQVVNLISYRVELYVLDRYHGIHDVGIYSVSVQTAETVWLVAGAIATSVTAPALEEDDRAAARLIGRSALRALLFTAALAVALGAVAPWLIPALLGDAFRGAAKPLALLLPGTAAYAPVTILVVYLSVRRAQPHLSLVVAVAGMMVTLAGAIALVPAHGASGAAIASTVGYTVAAALAWLFFARLARSP
jgi:O-antigen/teichoic acid export membrane protein